MYDPEFSIMIEKNLADMRDRVYTFSDSPLAPIFGSFYKAFELIEQRRNDYENCFDEDDREEMAVEIRGMIKDIQQIYEEFKVFLDK